MLGLRTLILAAAVLGAAAAAPRGATTPPNVLFIVLDDLGFNDVGFRSHEIRTPNVDALAQSGLVLDQYYVQDVCSPSRSTFMTGRYAMHHGVVDWIPPASSYGLPLNETTMAQLFKRKGYACHATGKWHMVRARLPPATRALYAAAELTASPSLVFARLLWMHLHRASTNGG